MYLNSLIAALNKHPLNCKFNNVPSGIATKQPGSFSDYSWLDSKSSHEFIKILPKPGIGVHSHPHLALRDFASLSILIPQTSHLTPHTSYLIPLTPLRPLWNAVVMHASEYFEEKKQASVNLFYYEAALILWFLGDRLLKISQKPFCILNIQGLIIIFEGC